jgi:hypothetical protein
MHIKNARKFTNNALKMNTIPYMLSIELPYLPYISSYLSYLNTFFFAALIWYQIFSQFKKEKARCFLVWQLLHHNNNFPCSSFTSSSFTKQVLSLFCFYALFFYKTSILLFLQEEEAYRRRSICLSEEIHDIIF